MQIFLFFKEDKRVSTKRAANSIGIRDMADQTSKMF